MEISSIELSSVLSRRNTETRYKVIYPHFQKMFIINVCKLFILQGSHRLEKALNLKGCLEKALNLP